MTDGRLHRFLSRFVDVRRDEARGALYLFSLFFFVTCSIYIIKPVKENFLIGVTPAWWPYADLITAALIGFVIALHTRLLNRLPRRSYVSTTIVFFIAGLLLFWLVFDMHLKSLALSPAADAPGFLGALSLLLAVQNSWPAPVLAFSLFTDIFIAMSVTQFWIAVNDVFNPHQAKRTVGFFVTGGLAGGVAGALLTSRLALALGPAALLLVCPVILVLVLTAVNLVYREQKKLQDRAEGGASFMAGSRVGYLESLRTVRSNRYLRVLAGVLASAMAVGTLINYQFKIVVKEILPDPTSRTSFLGTFFLAILGISLVFHLATTGRVLKRFGIRLALLVAPALLLIGTASAFLVPAAGLMVWACLLRGADKTLDTTMSQSVRELLYIPIPAEIKYKAKIFIDMFVNKFATGLAAAMFWFLYRFSSFAYKPPSVQVREVAVLVLGFVLAWVVLIWVIYAEYLGIVKKDLSRKWQEGSRVVTENVDVGSARLVFDTLQSRDRSATLYAMNMFQLVQREKLTPELSAVLALKEDEVTARSMDALLDVGGEVFYQGMEETLADKDFEVQIREILALDTYKSVMGQHFGAVAEGGSDSEVERMETARLLGLMEPSNDVARYLGRLLRDPSPEVLNYALASAAVHRRKEHVEPIVRLLANPMTRLEAQDALAAYGPRIVDPLRKHLQDSHEREDVRRAIPEILARFGEQKSADVLSAELERKRNESLERELIEALSKIRADHPEVRFRPRKVRAAVVSLVARTCPLLPAETGDAPAPDRRALLDVRIKMIFDLLSLAYPSEDIVRAYQNILQGTKKAMDYSLELLDNLLDLELKRLVFPLIEDLPPGERLRRLKKGLRGLERPAPARRLKWGRRLR